MKSEESVFTQFNFSFITFPRQTFVKIIDVNLENRTYRTPNLYNIKRSQNLTTNDKASGPTATL